MNTMDLTLIFLLTAVVLLHILFCYNAMTTKAHISNFKRGVWCGLSLFLGPLGFYLFQNSLPLDTLE